MMAVSSDLYVSVGKLDYVRGKASILRAQESLLKILKHYSNLQLLSKEKRLLKSKLSKTFNLAMTDVANCVNKMPSPKEVTKRIKEEKKEEERKKKMQLEKAKREESKEAKKKLSKKEPSSIDDELKEVQRKLRLLGI